MGCVSIPNGARCKEAIQNNYEWINYYDKVVLFFDNDEGQGQSEAAGVLPPGKVFIGFLDDYKDAQRLYRLVTVKLSELFAIRTHSQA